MRKLELEVSGFETLIGATEVASTLGGHLVSVSDCLFGGQLIPEDDTVIGVVIKNPGIEDVNYVLKGGYYFHLKEVEEENLKEEVEA